MLWRVLGGAHCSLGGPPLCLTLGSPRLGAAGYGAPAFGGSFTGSFTGGFAQPLGQPMPQFQRSWVPPVAPVRGGRGLKSTVEQTV